MIISHRFQFIFIKTAKTASTSMEIYLSQFLDDEDILTPFAYAEPGHNPRNHVGRSLVLRDCIYVKRLALRPLRQEVFRTLRDWRHKRLFYGHMPAWRVRSRIGERVWNDYFKFTIERNPWDKVISSYWYRKKMYGPRSLSLDEHLAFLSAYKEKNLYGVGIAPFNFPLYSDRNGNKLVDRVLRWENLDDEFGSVLKRIGMTSDFGGLREVAKSRFRDDNKNYRTCFSGKQMERVKHLFSDEIQAHGYQF